VKSDAKKMTLKDFHEGKHDHKREVGDAGLADVLKSLLSKLGCDGKGNSEFS
jgi:hypothetical protein